MIKKYLTEFCAVQEKHVHESMNLQQITAVSTRSRDLASRIGKRLPYYEDVPHDRQPQPSLFDRPNLNNVRGGLRSLMTSSACELPQTPDVPQWRLITLTLAMCGIQICYSAQINMGTSHLLLLGISPRTVSLAWLAGPLSGLIVQPIIGHFSDKCYSPLGRRRPFLIAGTIFTSLSLLLFANASQIISFLIGSDKGALVLAVCAFFLLDFSIQAIQAPLRALVTDYVPRGQRARGNCYIAVFSGLGNLMGSLLTSVHLSARIPFFASDVQALFAIAVLILVITVSITVLFTPETSSYTFIEDETESHTRRPDVTTIWQDLRQVPVPFWRVFFVQLCTWCGFFALFVYINSWVGQNIYMGDGTAPSGSDARSVFEEGVRLGGKGNALTAIVTVLYALLLPKLLHTFGTLPVYTFGQVVEAFVLMVSPLLRGTAGKVPGLWLKILTVGDIGMFGIVWATTLGVPWTLIGNALESDSRYASRIGLFQTIFNASQSGPQLIVGITAPAILAVANDDPAAVMFCGGVCAAVGAALILILRVGEEKDVGRDMLLNGSGEGR